MDQLSKKPILTIFTEATVVGICLILFVQIVKYFEDKIPNFSGKRGEYEIYFIAGFLFHVIAEWSGVNLWYSKEYCKLL